MSTPIKPRKKALRLNSKPILIGWTTLLTLMFALGAADRSYAHAEQPAPAGSPASTDVASTGAPAGSVPRPRSHRQPRRTPVQVIDANVRRLTQALKLNQEQQTKLREILVDQYVGLTKLRTQSAPGMDRTGAMRAIIDRTRERIRDMLNDEQKKQYATDVPSELTAATRADLEHWLDVRDAQRKEATEEPK